MARIFGIDLGTTNSLIAYMDGQTPRVIPGRNGRAMVPSVVALTDNGLLVGDPAKEYLVRDSERTVYSVKRFMLLTFLGTLGILVGRIIIRRLG